MSLHVSQRSRQAVQQSRASGIFFLSIFGAIWGLVGTNLLSGIGRISADILIGLVTLAFFVIGIRLIRSARKLSDTVTPEEVAEDKRIRTWFGVVFGVELVLIMLVVLLLPKIGAGRLLSPGIALIVGVHFLPLARLFSARVYYATGALLILVALVALFLILQHIGFLPDTWSLFSSVAAALILWLTLLFNACTAIMLIRQDVEDSTKNRTAL